MKSIQRRRQAMISFIFLSLFSNFLLGRSVSFTNAGIDIKVMQKLERVGDMDASKVKSESTSGYRQKKKKRIST